MSVKINPFTGDFDFVGTSSSSSGSISNGATDPVSPSNFEFFYNTTTHTFKMYLFDTWIPFVDFKDIMLTDEGGNIVIDESSNPVLETNQINFIRSN